MRKICVLVMRRVKLAKAFHRGEHRPHQEEIGEELVLPALWQIAIMRSIVTHDDQSVLARANEHDREHVQHRVPKERAERDRSGDSRPFPGGRSHRPPRLKRGELLDHFSRQPLLDGSASVMRMDNDRIAYPRKSMTLLTLAKYGIGLVTHDYHSAVAHSRVHSWAF
jgi:hypothetical protein